MTNTIFDTKFADQYNLKTLAKRAVGVVEGLPLDLDQAEYHSLVRGANPLMRNALSEAFRNIKQQSVLEKMYYVSTITDKEVSVPEVLAMDDLTIIGEQAGHVSNKEARGAWVCLNSCLTAPRARYDGVTVSSVNQLSSTVVRAGMCMAYAKNNYGWLGDKSMAFMVSVYAHTVHSILNRLFNLDIEESSLVRYAFAHYYASKLTNHFSPSGMPLILNRCSDSLFKGKVVLSEYSDRMLAITGKANAVPTMEDAVEFVKEYGPKRASRLDANMIYRAAYTNSRKSLATHVAMDYPPYLAYLLLRLSANDKHPLFTRVLNDNFKKQFVDMELDSFAKDKRTFAI